MILLGTLALNEMEWLPSLYQQHKDWPELSHWVFVESADKAFAEANPDMVSSQGLSVDGTSEWLEELATKDERVTYIPHGFTSHANAAQGKCAARNRYFDIANEVKPDFVFILDADEFYTKNSQLKITYTMDIQRNPKKPGFIFGLRSIWRPPSISELPLFTYEAVGCLFSVPICRGWLWKPGMKHTGNHNNPCDAEGNAQQMMRCEERGIDCLHMGFASSLKNRQAKRAYYEHRGEGKVDHRQKYVDCRRFFETYELGDTPPHDVRIVKYRGPIPEVFQ